jgi:hypothetical protein
MHFNITSLVTKQYLHLFLSSFKNSGKEKNRHYLKMPQSKMAFTFDTTYGGLKYGQTYAN